MAELQLPSIGQDVLPPVMGRLICEFLKFQLQLCQSDQRGSVQTQGYSPHAVICRVQAFVHKCRFSRELGGAQLALISAQHPLWCLWPVFQNSSAPDLHPTCWGLFTKHVATYFSAYKETELFWKFCPKHSVCWGGEGSTNFTFIFLKIIFSKGHCQLKIYVIGQHFFTFILIIV